MTRDFIRSQLKRIRAYTDDSPIVAERKGQALLGRLLRSTRLRGIKAASLSLSGVRATLFTPAKPDRAGAALYLHGGGYCCGDIPYAEGFGSVLASESNLPVLCPAYRLAPEHPFPAAVEDAMGAYRYLLARWPAEKIVLVGESAGGGLVYSLCLAAKREGLPLPGGLIAISPWTDLTLSGSSYRDNEKADPSMTKAHLAHFARLYAPDRAPEPLVSPLFGDLTGLPPSLLFVGGDEIMRDDAVRLDEKLRSFGCHSYLVVAPGMWHAYVLYGLKERRGDMEAIRLRMRGIAQ